MSTAVVNGDAVKLLRRTCFEEHALLFKAGSLWDEKLEKLLKLVKGDVGLAVDAVGMYPRPEWLVSLIGPPDE